MNTTSLRRFAVVFCLFVALAPRAHGWGDDGHEIVGAIAEARLKSKNARAQVARILQGESLASACTWADRVKKVAPTDLLQPKARQAEAIAQIKADPDSVAFIEGFPPTLDPRTQKVAGLTGRWHYVDLPLDAKGYADPRLAAPIHGEPPFSDIVQKLEECLKALQDPKTPAGGAFGQRNALRMLAHLIGDLHQPLHVGCAYLDLYVPDPANAIVADPDLILAKRLRSDQGGNALCFQLRDTGINLHAFWDGVLVTDAMARAGGLSREAYAAKLASRPPLADATSTLTVSALPRSWADDSLLAARQAYAGVKLTALRKQPFQTQYGPNPGYPISLPEGYEERMTTLAEQRLALAGQRLAAVLDRLWP